MLITLIQNFLDYKMLVNPIQFSSPMTLQVSEPTRILLQLLISPPVPANSAFLKTEAFSRKDNI